MNLMINGMIVSILWKNLINGSLTVEEQETLNKWLEASALNRELFEEIMDDEKRNTELKFLLKQDARAAWYSDMLPALEKEPKVKVIEMPTVTRAKIRWPKIAVAAALIIAVSVGIYHLIHVQPQPQVAKVNTSNSGAPNEDYNARIHPASDKAIVTVENESGVKIESFDLKKVQGDVAYNEGRNSFQNKWKEKGSVVRFSEVNPHPAFDQLPLTFNTLSTPRGGRYQVVLPDGSQVWLNAESKLRFPSFFNSKKRVVELTGEAYFEVKPVFLSAVTKEKIPFFVKVNNSLIEVVGTHFNVKAYSNQHEREMAATLLEGNIKVSKDNESCTLNPGEQAKVSITEELPANPIRKSRVNTADAVGWKDGYFILNNRTAEDIVMEISRAYDLNAMFPANISRTKIYDGTINSESKITSVMSVLARLGIETKIEGNTLVVL